MYVFYMIQCKAGMLPDGGNYTDIRSPLFMENVPDVGLNHTEKGL